jgi:hypothetical protein
MTYIKWECGCGKVFISNTNRYHQLDICKKCGSFLDAETYYCRLGGDYMHIESYNYDFFTELVLCMKEQGLSEFIDTNYLTLKEVMFIRELEDEICEGLK